MIDIYCDCADLEQIREMKKNPIVRGFTTNPTLMRNAGVTDYEAFCKEALQIVEGLPISFEVFSDDFMEMENQARKIASWGQNIYIKIPITNTHGDTTEEIVRGLTDDDIRCNVTAVFTWEQIKLITGRVNPEKNPYIISVFAGRISDCSQSPPIIQAPHSPTIKFLWASTREVLNIYHATKSGYDIITITPELLRKYELFKEKDLTEFSLETVKTFYEDARKSGYYI